MTNKVACARSRHDDQDDNKMSTLQAFINFIFVKIFRLCSIITYELFIEM